MRWIAGLLALWLTVGAFPRCAVAQIADLFADGVPATWMDGTDDFKEQPPGGSDAADSSRPDIFQYEGVQYHASGVGPNGEAGLNVTATSRWSFAAAVFSDIGNVPLSGTVPGNGWDMTTGRAVVRYYIDSVVKSEAAYLLPISIYSSNSRDGLTGTMAVSVGFFDDDGTNFAIDTFAGTRTGSDFDTSASHPWSDILDKWVEWDVRWRCETPGSSDGYVTIRMRTSTDGTTWTDLPGTTDAVVLDTQNQPIGNAFFAYHVGNVTYGMTAALGFDGMPGKAYYAVLYDSDATSVAPPSPIDNGTRCCNAVDGSGTGVTGGIAPGVDPYAPLPPSEAQCSGLGTVPTASDPTAGETWSD